MSLGPFPVEDAIARLREVATLKTVGNAADLRAALDAQPAVDAAAWATVQEAANPHRGGSRGALIQRVTVDLGVVLYVRSYRDARAGAGANARMRELIAGSRGALLNWLPPLEAATVLELRGSRAEALAGGNLWWQEIYRCEYTLRTP